MRNFFLTVLCLGIMSLSSIKAVDSAKKLVLTGSSTVAPLMSEIGKAYEKNHPGIHIDVQSGGSSRGVTDTRQGLANIGMVSRALNSDETDFTAYTVAWDGVGIIVHSTNTVQSLTDGQIRDIYTGKITDWSRVGGKAGVITVVNKAEGRSTLELFLHYTKLKAPDIKAHVVIGDNQQGIKTVAGNPNAIGYVSIGSAEYEAKHGVKIKLLPMAGIPANLESVQKGIFPLSRPLNLVVKEKPTGLTKDFLDFSLSHQVDEIIKSQYFVPVSSSKVAG